MFDRGLSANITRAAGGLSLWTIIAIANPSGGLAQLPMMQPTPPTQPQGTTLPVEPNYTLCGGDRIRIDILDEPGISGEYSVPLGGTLSLPLVGNIDVLGATIDQADAAITNAYARYLKRPVITVTLLSPRPLNVWISGEVNNPGVRTIRLIQGEGALSGVQYPTVTQAIQLGGGVTLAADVRNIQVRRPQPSGAVQVINVNLWEVLQTGDRTQDLLLRDGDTIYVPTAISTNLTETRQLTSTGFAAPLEQPRTVAVVGEVYRPGTYAVTGAATASELRPGGLPTVIPAIQLAGGITPLADIRNIHIRRPTKIGTEQIISVNLWQLLQVGDLSQDATLQNGDTIVIPTATAVNPAEASDLATSSLAPRSIQVSVVGEVQRPGVVAVPPNTTLNQALLVAGGLRENRANRSNVELIRLNPDGTVSREIVALDFSEGLNNQNNPLLQNNDVVLVNPTGLARFSDNVEVALSPALRFRQTLDVPVLAIELLRLLGIIRRD